MTSQNNQKIRKENGPPIVRRPNNPLTFIDAIEGFIPTVSAAPTWTPKKFSEQFAVYKNATTYRFYWYDSTNAEWRYTSGT